MTRVPPTHLRYVWWSRPEGHAAVDINHGYVECVRQHTATAVSRSVWYWHADRCHNVSMEVLHGLHGTTAYHSTA